MKKYVSIFAFASLLVGCSASTTQTQVIKQEPSEVTVRNIPGVVEYIWEEPMIDVVDVPPGLDPEGHYYRPAHQEVVEIKQGRWQYYRRPGR